MLSTYIKRKCNLLYYRISRILFKYFIHKTEISEKVILNRLEFFFFSNYKKEEESLLDAKKRWFISQKPNANIEKIQKLNVELLKEFVLLCERNELTYFMSYGSALGAVRHKGFIPWDDDLDVSMSRDDFHKLLQIISFEDKYKIDEPSAPRTNARVYKFKYKTTIGFRPNIDIFVYDVLNIDTGTALSIRKKYIKKGWLRASFNLRVRRLFKCSDIKNNIAIYKTDKYLKYYEMLNKIDDAYKNKLIKNANEKMTKKIVYDITRTDDCCVIEKINRVYEFSTIFPLKTASFNGLIVNIPNDFDAYLKRNFGDYYSLPRTFANHLGL